MSLIINNLFHTEALNDPTRRPKNWREIILTKDPNGDCPLTAITSMLPTATTDDPEFLWYEKERPRQLCAITGVYTDAALLTAYNPAAAVNLAAVDGILYFKGAEADMRNFRPNHEVLLKDATFRDISIGIVGFVMEVSYAGASSYAKVKLLQADFSVNAAGAPVAAGDHDHGYLEFISPDSVGYLWVIGSAHEEGSGKPKAVYYEPVRYMNQTQIWKTSLAMTNTAIKTKLRTGDQIQQSKQEALWLHGTMIDRSLLFGHKHTITNPDDGRVTRFTSGLLYAQDINDAYLVQKYIFSGTWAGTGGTGWNWLRDRTEQIFAYGSTSRLALCGPGVLNSLQDMVLDKATMMLRATETKFGMKFIEFETPHGVLYFKRHPGFVGNPLMYNSAIVMDLDDMRWRPLTGRDTKYKEHIQENDIDAEESMYITEGGLEFGAIAKSVHFLGNLGGS